MTHMREVTLSSKQLSNYMEDSSLCPLCGGDEIKMDKSRFTFSLIHVDEVHLPIECKGCHAVWEDVYTLSGATFVEVPE